MTTIECFTEQDARDTRRSYIVNGHTVSLIGWNPTTGMHVFDVLDADPS